MDKLTPAQERTIGTVVQRLIKAARPPAELRSMIINASQQAS